MNWARAQLISGQADISYRQLFADKYRQTKANKSRKAMLFELQREAVEV